MAIRISVLTYCKNRLAQAKVMVPHTYGKLGPSDELMFVDYSCDDVSGRWVWRFASGLAANYRVRTLVMMQYHQWWQMSHARNCAARAASGDIFVFTDVDNLIPDGLLERIRMMPEGVFYALLPGPNVSGFCAIHRCDFFKVNGYEEGLTEIYDDTNLYRACDLAGIKRVDLTDVKMEVIDGDKPDEQVRVTEFKDRNEMWRQNEAITNILRTRHQYKNNVGRNWGLGWRLLNS